MFIDCDQALAYYTFYGKLPESYQQEVYYEQRQIASSDSLIEGRKGKMFLRQETKTYIISGDTTVRHRAYQSYYAAGIGLFSTIQTDTTGPLSRTELVEQISLKQFKEMADHGVKRIGYIDPQSVLDPETDFQPCGSHDAVADYYNGQRDRAQYKGGKKAIWALTKKHLQQDLLFRESGYLTLRFIINCKGEAGWFTMEEADLDFQPKKFPSETIQHFFEILYDNPDWEPVILRGEASDAYTYITFKLKHGELIEILP